MVFAVPIRGWFERWLARGGAAGSRLGFVAGVRGMRGGFGSWSRRRAKVVQPFAVAGQRRQAPFAVDLVEAAQGEGGEAGGRLDDAEHWFDGLLAQRIQGAPAHRA